MLRFVARFIVSLTLASLVPVAGARPLAVDPKVPVIAYVTFPSLHAQPLAVGGHLRVPSHVEGKVPAVVIAHGSAGVDSRGSFHADALNDAGIATLEIDMWAARGIAGGLNRPAGVPETLPDAYGALKFLAAHPRIDAARIGIMGFSWGGVVSMLTATQPYTDLYTGGSLRFAAHAPNYPVCWIYNRLPGYEFNSFTGAPVFIQVGALDDYHAADTCPNLVASLGAAQEFITVTVYKGATHAWDRLQPAMTVVDPVAHFGQGGEVRFVPNPHVARKSRRATLRFFQRAFGMAHAHGD